MANSPLPRLLVLRDPRDGRTVRISLAFRDGRYWIEIDSGDAFDGTHLANRWHPDETRATQDLDDLLRRYRHAGYQVFSDNSAGARAEPVRRPN